MANPLHPRSSIWTCKIGSLDVLPMPPGADAPMRDAVEDAYRQLTGEDAQFTFSGWSAQLTEGELACVQDREPDERLGDLLPGDAKLLLAIIHGDAFDAAALDVVVAKLQRIEETTL